MATRSQPKTKKQTKAWLLVPKGSVLTKRRILTKHPSLVSDVSANFCGKRGCHVVRTTDLHGRYFQFSRSEPPIFINLLLSFLTRLSGPNFQSLYFLENLVVPGIEPGTSLFVARNSGNKTTDLVLVQEPIRKIIRN
jgi:hypothetical protein